MRERDILNVLSRGLNFDTALRAAAAVTRVAEARAEGKLTRWMLKDDTTHWYEGRRAKVKKRVRGHGHFFTEVTIEERFYWSRGSNANGFYLTWREVLVFDGRGVIDRVRDLLAAALGLAMILSGMP